MLFKFGEFLPYFYVIRPAAFASYFSETILSQKFRNGAEDEELERNIAITATQIWRKVGPKMVLFIYLTLC